MKQEKKIVLISALKHPEINSRIHPRGQIEELKKSLKKWGQYRDIVIDKKNVIIIGNGLVEAARELEWEKLNAIIVSGISEAEKKKLMLSDNKLSDLGYDSTEAIEQIIKGLGDDLVIPGFDEEILRSIAYTEQEISRAMEDYGTATDENKKKIDSKKEINNPSGKNANTNNTYDVEHCTCPKCGHKFEL